MKHKNIIILGAPGVGKGTTAKLLMKKFSIPQISTGHILRKAKKEGTELGKKVKKYMENGELIPDEIMIDIIKDRISKHDCKNGFILDGFPRTEIQAKALERIIEIDKVLYLKANRKTVIQRLSGRRTCRKCRIIYHIKNKPSKVEGICDKCGRELHHRDDDQPQVIRERLAVYERKTKPLIDYYKQKGILATINAEEEVHEVFKNGVQALKK